MRLRTINRASAIVPIALSLTASGIAVVGALTGWGKGDADEGAGAHIFQLLIVAEVPFVVVFVATAQWNRIGRVAAVIALQAAAVGAAIAPVFLFKL